MQLCCMDMNNVINIDCLNVYIVYYISEITIDTRNVCWTYAGMHVNLLTSL